MVVFKFDKRVNYSTFNRVEGIQSEDEGGNDVSYKEAEGAAEDLEYEEAVAELGLVGIAEKTQPGVDKGVVVVHTF